MMFAAAYGRADVIRLLATKGADPSSHDQSDRPGGKFAKEEQERFAQFLQQQGSRSSQGQAAQTQARGGRGRQTGAAGIDRQYSYTELVGYQGGSPPCTSRRARDRLEAVQALLEARADVNQRSAGDKTTPIIVATLNGHFDLARFMLDRRRRPEPCPDERRYPALCGDQLSLGAAGALSAAARLRAAEDRPTSI